MTNDFIDNNDSSDSSIFKAHVRAEDLSQQEKINDYKAAIEESFRKDFLRRQEVENQAYGHVDEVLSNVDLRAVEEEDYFTDSIDSLLAKLFKLFNFWDSELEMEADQQAYSVIKEKKEKDLLAAIIKFLHDKLKKLIKAVFSRDLSLNDRLDEEIKELQAKLDGGGLSEEEFARVLDRLESLRDLKLKLQIFVTGWVISAIAAMLEVEFTALVETGTSKEEDKKAEPKEKEATKEVREDVEIKVDAREKPQPSMSISLFDFSSGLAKPIPLTKPEFNLLPEPIRNIVIDSPLKVVINEVPKPKAVEGNKEAKQEAPKTAAPAFKQPVTNTAGLVRDGTSYGCDSSKKRRINQGNNRQALNQLAQSSISSGKVPKQFVKTPVSSGETQEQSASSVANYEYDFTNWKGAEYEPKQSSVGNAQPTGECSSVKINNHVESTGKAPEPSRGR